MDNIILKASKGNRVAMNQLYEANKNQVYYVANALLRGSTSAIEAAKWAIISSLQAVSCGTIQTEEGFADYTILQVAKYCKKDITKKDSHAFRVPPKKNFRITSVDENVVKSAKRPCEYYFNSLPASQRFVFVLRLIGGMNEEQLSDVIGLKASIIHSIIEVEPDNLGKIYLVAKANDAHCVPPTKELISSSFKEELSKVSVPDALDKKVEDYIDSVATPIEDAEKKKYKKHISITIAAIICIVALILVFSGSEDDDTSTDSVGTTETTVSDSENGEDEVVTDETEAEDEVTTEDTSISEVFDSTLTYYADIEIEGYGTITVLLDQEAAPVTVENFVTLAESGFYDGLTFHRIIEGFMMQGGDPNGDGTGGSEETIVGEFTDNGYENELSHTRGAISMARSDEYDSASSQFFIVHEDSSSSLDGQYAVFGYVTEGMEIVDEVCETAEPTDSNGSIASDEQPIITSITIRTEAAE